MSKPTTDSSDTGLHIGRDPREQYELLAELLEQTRIQTRLLANIRLGVELDPCLLDKIARIACLTANEVHQQTIELRVIRQTLDSLLELSRTTHPDAALQIDRLAKLRVEMEKCCPPEHKPELICHYEPCPRDGGLQVGTGSSRKSRGVARPVQVSDEHESWKIVDRPHHEDDDQLPVVAQGSLFAQLKPSAPTPQVMKFMSGGGPMPGGQQPVTFRTFTGTEVAGTWPPDMSGAKAGDVVLMSGNLWLKLSVDGGKTFTDLDFTKLFAADNTYGGWAGDQVVHYVPSIDCFALYVQSYKGTGANANKNVIKIALASPADVKKFAGKKPAWKRQWDFTSDEFGLGAAWMDFPDITYGDKFLHVNTNVLAGQTGKLFFELPLADLKAGGGFNYQFAFVSDAVSGGEPKKRLTFGSPIQNILGDDNYWPAHVDNSTMRIFYSRGGDADYSWRDRKIANWPTATNNDVFSRPPDYSDWVSEDHRIIGATRVASTLWFAWTAATGDGGGGGFSFPHAHIQIAKFSLTDDFKLVGQEQVWNPDHAFAYASLTTNSDNEVGISLGWGGGDKYYGSHAVGILGDFVLWYGEGSELTSLRQQQDDAGNLLTNPSDGSPLMYSRWGDYVHVRLAQPDTRYFSAFGYAVRKNPGATPPDKFDFLYIEFGRELPPPSPGLH